MIRRKKFLIGKTGQGSGRGRGEIMETARVPLREVTASTGREDDRTGDNEGANERKTKEARTRARAGESWVEYRRNSRLF